MLYCALKDYRGQEFTVVISSPIMSSEAQYEKDMLSVFARIVAELPKHEAVQLLNQTSAELSAWVHKAPAQREARIRLQRLAESLGYLPLAEVLNNNEPCQSDLIKRVSVILAVIDATLVSIS